eukprot:1982005-Alexandrium_andersonii.AAC.1
MPTGLSGQRQLAGPKPSPKRPLSVHAQRAERPSPRFGSGGSRSPSAPVPGALETQPTLARFRATERAVWRTGRSGAAAS